MALQDYEASVQPEALPGRPYPRFPDEVSPEAMGAGIGRGFETAGAVEQEVHNRAQEQARQVQVMDAHNQMQALSVKLLHDPQSGAFTKEGKDAFGLPDQYLPQFDQQAAQIVSGVPDPRARAIAQQTAAQLRNQFTEQLDTHELQQHREFDAKTTQASIQIAQQTAGLNANHPDIIASNRDTIAFSLERLAKQQGWSDEELTASKMKAMDGLHENVVRAFVSSGNTQLAQTYINQHLMEMDPQASESMQRLIFATEEHKLAMYEKYQKIGSDNLSKEGDSLLAQGKLTPAWIEQHRNALEANEFRYFYKALSGTDEAVTNPRMFSGLLLRAANGEDVRDEARSALVDQHALSISDFKAIVSNVDSARPGWFKRGTQFLSEALDPGQLNPDPAAHQSKAQALSDWQEWAAKHADATDDQAKKMQEELAHHYQIVPEGKTALLMRAPRYLVGTRANPVDENGNPDPMMNATVKRMTAALQAGEITQEDAQEQAKLIMQYRKIYQAQQAAKAAKAKAP